MSSGTENHGLQHHKQIYASSWQGGTPPPPSACAQKLSWNGTRPLDLATTFTENTGDREHIQ